jgi:hypothetical protein
MVSGIRHRGLQQRSSTNVRSMLSNTPAILAKIVDGRALISQPNGSANGSTSRYTQKWRLCTQLAPVQLALSST